MNERYRNLVLFALAFSLAAAAGTRYQILGAFLAGLYLPNGIAHFAYGILGFGKMAPKRLFGEERKIHAIWGVFNLILFAILARYSSISTNWPAFIAAVLMTLLLLPIMAKKEERA